MSAYLDEFLTDPRVVQLPQWLWKPLLRKLILPKRSPVVAKKYASIWMPEGSPLAVYTRQLAQAVQALWSEVLGVQQVAPRDNFFALGGHSLLAIQLHRTMRDRLSLPRLGVTDIFRFPVMADFLKHVAT